jgi:hypothetical protein
MKRRMFISLFSYFVACFGVLEGCRSSARNRLVVTAPQQAAFGRPSADLWRLPTAKMVGRIKELAEAGVTINKENPMPVGNEFTSQRLRIREAVQDGTRLHFVYFDLDIDSVTIVYTFDAASNRWLYRWILRSDL